MAATLTTASPARAQPLIAPPLSGAEHLAADTALAEGIYTDEILRDPAAAVVYFRRVIGDTQSTAEQRHAAGWRLARCLRRLHRPDSARAVLGDLLRDPTLTEEIRVLARGELAAMPLVEPARLMPTDTLVYAEFAEPGWTLEQLVLILRRAGLADRAQQQLLDVIRHTTTIELSGFLNEALRDQLKEIEGIGVGWHNVHFRVIDGHFRPTADVLIVVHTGRSGATAAVVPGILTALLRPEQEVDGVLFYALPGARPSLRLALAEGLLVACTDVTAGAAAVQRYRAATDGLGAPPRSFHNDLTFRRHFTMLRQAGAAALYVDAPRLLDTLRSDLPAGVREDWDMAADALALREFGPLVASLSLPGDRLEAEFSLSLNSESCLPYRAWRTPPLDQRWYDWLPANAAAGCVLGFGSGDRRWRDIERLLLEIERLRQLWPAAVPEQRAAAGHWVSRLRALEQETRLSIADDVCRSVRGLALTWLLSDEEAADFSLRRWALMLEVDQAEPWLRRIERGLRLWLFGNLADAPMPTVHVDTAIGAVDLLAIPGTRYGVAWQPEGNAIAAALSTEALTDYVTHVRSGAVQSRLPTRRDVSKLAVIRLDVFAGYLVSQLGWRPASQPALPASPDLRVRDPLPPAEIAPLQIRTHELPTQLRVVVVQDELSAALRAIGKALAPVDKQAPVRQ